MCVCASWSTFVFWFKCYNLRDLDSDFTINQPGEINVGVTITLFHNDSAGAMPLLEYKKTG